ncbi:MAG: PaaI family thioesterase [Candidatus Rokubacteria bacterium]|nr:PaaI family thioesterase [Candidatus Rokubacteria bacterium]
MPAIPPHDARDFGGLVGIQALALGDGRSRCSLTIDGRHYNPNGVLHGGVTFTLTDVAMGSAVFSTLPKGERTTAMEVQVRFLRAVMGGTLTVEGEVVSRHERIAVTRADVRDDGGHLVATATGTFYIFPNSTSDAITSEERETQ